MAVRSAAMRWLLTIPLALIALYTVLCMAFYIAGARHLPDRLVPSASQAPPEVRAQLLRVEADMAPDDTVPRLHPLTVIPKVLYHVDPGPPRNDFMRGYRLVAIAARMRHPSHLRLRSFGRHMTEIALAIRISREWTTDDIADTLLAESFYGRCSIGIEHASQAYFGRPAAQLQPQESLALIALRKGPSGYDLDRNPERFRKRYAQLAEKLGHRGPDWSADAALARLTPATCTGTSLRRTGRAGQRA
jgi:hypothetical protein